MIIIIVKLAFLKLTADLVEFESNLLYDSKISLNHPGGGMLLID